MADPITLMAVAAGGGALLSAYGSVQQGEANAASLSAQESVNRYNAEVQRRQGEQEMQAATANSNLQREKAVQLAGKQQAALAESGGGFTPTVSMLIDQSAAQAELDRQNILYGGALKQNQFNNAAALSDFQADYAKSQIGAARTAGYIGAASSLLSGAANVGMMTRGKF